MLEFSSLTSGIYVLRAAHHLKSPLLRNGHTKDVPKAFLDSLDSLNSIPSSSIIMIRLHSGKHEQRFYEDARNLQIRCPNEPLWPQNPQCPTRGLPLSIRMVGNMRLSVFSARTNTADPVFKQTHVMHTASRKHSKRQAPAPAVFIRTSRPEPPHERKRSINFID